MSSERPLATTPRWARIAAVLLVALFVGLGSQWIAWPGLHYDEARFVLATYAQKPPPYTVAYMMNFKSRPVALMVVSYMGALKGWLYIPILKAWPGSVTAIRLPVLLIGAAGLCLFYLFARRALGWQAALAALALACSDPVYLFTTRLDWGPVAIQHLCLLAGCCGVLRWWQERRLRDLALGFFAMGLGIFDKATFLWLLAALGGATAIVFARQLRSAIRVRPAATALASLLIGAAPFLYYCWKWPGETFRQQYDRPQEYPKKIRAFQYTLQGTPLVSWISREMEGPPLDPPGRLARLVYATAPREPFAETLLLPATVLALLALLALPSSPWRRGTLFALLFCLLGFLPMLLTRNAGWVHHVALLFPFPQLFVAAGMIGVKERIYSWVKGPAWRRVATASLWLLVLLLVGANLRAVAHHYFRVLGFGGGVNWSEAIYSLQQSLEKRQAEKIFVLDWGMMTQLRLLSAGRLPVEEAVLPGDGGPGNLDSYLSNPRVVYVKYGLGEPAMVPQAVEAFFKLIARRGYGAEVLETVSDRRGRPIYEILSLRSQAAP